MAAVKPRGSDRRTARSPPPLRDTDSTAFTSILADLVRRVPGAYAAAIVDAEGECVDYTGRVDPFDIKLAAAHWRILLSEVSALWPPGTTRWLVVRAGRRSFLTYALPDNYAIVALLGRRAGFAPFARALTSCARALSVEARLGSSAARTSWTAVEVECNRHGRPVRLTLPGDAAHAVEIIGSVVGQKGRERGYRVRIDTGAELTLVREPGGFWYTDEPLSVPMR
jgi:hypothetical protein